MTVIIDTPRSPRTITVRLGTFTQRRRRDITTPSPPAHPFGSPDLRILRAWIEAELANPGDSIAVMAAVATAIERCLGQRNASGQVSDVYDRLPLWMRPHFGLAAGEGLKRLLGRWDKQGRFVPAEVGERWRLTEDEAAVYWWDIRGWTFEEIQRELTPPGLRGDRTRWRGAEQVHRLRESARRKVRGMFGVA